MKQTKKALAFLLAAVMAFTVALPAFAFEADAGDLFLDVREWPNFNSVTGVVTSIDEHEAGKRIGIGYSSMNDEGATLTFSGAYFNVTPNTFFLGEKPQLGDTITGFFDNNMPMILIYPPQYAATVIVNREQYDASIYVDRFTTVETYDGNTEMISHDGFRRLNANNPGTTVISQGGQDASDWDLNDRLLVVVYDLASRSMPPLIFAPQKIIVMYEIAVHPIGDISDMDLGYIGIVPPIGDISDMGWGYADLDERRGIGEPAVHHVIHGYMDGVTVNGMPLAGVVAHSADGEFLTHVPLRAVAEVLDPNISIRWENGRVLLDGAWGEVSFAAGERTVYANGNTVTLASAPINADGRIYVPLSFFRQVAGMNNAYSQHGQVHINNFEVME
ncbi:MAG: copper amine oxidase N-terminal domain-containing protein [Defluviitaleaceae bacterium]|nr:copper amine oxidase N-terminal domain-containing protein [Defluviitaleaceae bacterium]MCL2274808.1 copper amine oxidase N-terminal domain-containing protein [Defluviitaleaceae bacterium]